MAPIRLCRRYFSATDADEPCRSIRDQARRRYPATVPAVGRHRRTLRRRRSSPSGCRSKACRGAPSCDQILRGDRQPLLDGDRHAAFAKHVARGPLAIGESADERAVGGVSDIGEPHWISLPQAVRDDDGSRPRMLRCCGNTTFLTTACWHPPGKQKALVWPGLSSGPPETRTRDPLIKSPGLEQRTPGHRDVLSKKSKA